MCDERTERENEEFLKGQVSRRRFSALTGAAGLAALLPGPAHATAISEADVKVTTPDGVADCYFVHPSDGKHPGVVVWPDAYGLRPAFRSMGKRLAESGYAVLVVNPYYRKATAPIFTESANFSDPAVRNKLEPLYSSLTPETTAADAIAFIGYIDRQKAVDTKRKMGTTGYCMGGAMALRTAAAVPDRVGAGASFHGGRLVTKDASSPHLLIPKTRARFLFAIAENDDKAEPEAKTVLREAYAKAGLAAEIEVYAGALHGWCAIDSRVYNEAQAERAWSRLLALFEEALA